MTERAVLPHDAESAGVTIAMRGSAGIVTLTRPARRNALTASMCKSLAATYPRLARDPIIYAAVVRSAHPAVFSAGVDLVGVASLSEAGPDGARAAIADALWLCWLHECFTKPTISLIDGMAMGSGFGIGLHGTHRVAGEGYAFTCPETGVGLVPAGGICHALARMPGSVGVYLALTGAAIGRADAFRLGLVTHCLPAGRFEAVETRLADADPVDAVLDALHADPGPGDLVAVEPVIARCFSAPTVEEIRARLDAEAGTHATWARETATRLTLKSPLALKLTHRLLGEAGALDLRGLLMLEHRLLCRLVARPDFATGVRAVLVDRSGSPAWAPAVLGDVTPATVTGFFTDDAGLGLALPTRGEMQGRAGAAAVPGSIQR